MEETTVQEEKKPEEKKEAQPQRSSRKIKKRWFPLIAPKEFNEAFLGETFVDDPNKVVGKTVKVNLMHLTKDPKKQSMVVTFTVAEVKNNQANTILTSYQIPPAHIKRFTKRSKSKVEDSSVYITSDKVNVQIKLVLMGRFSAANAKLTLLRREAKKLLENFVGKKTFSQVMKDVLSGNLQREIKGLMKKYHAISTVVIRVAKKLPKTANFK